jgi:hypothetical protein
MKTIDILQDVEQLTGVKKSVLTKIANACNFAIIDNVIENKLADDWELKLNIGIGNILLSVNNDELTYYFEPSSALENGLIKSINDNDNPLERQLLNNINKHIYKTYKDMLE